MDTNNPENDMIELELSEDEVIIPQKRKLPEAKPNMFSVATNTKQHQKQSSVPVEEILVGLNVEYVEYQTLMPYSSTLILEDIERSRLFAMQIIVKDIGTDSSSHILVTGSGRLGGTGSYLKIEKVDYNADMVACVNKFKQLFKDKTMNEWEDRGNLLEIPGCYKLYGTFSFSLHGVSSPTVSDDKKNLINTITFIKMKANHFTKSLTSNIFNVTKTIDWKHISSLLSAFNISEEFYFSLSGRKLSQLWKVLTHISRELTKLSPSTKNLVDFSAELNHLLMFEKENQVLSKMELKEIVEKVKLVQDLAEYKNYIEQVAGFLANEYTYLDYIRSCGLDQIKALSDEGLQLKLKESFKQACETSSCDKYAISQIYTVQLSNFEGCFVPFKTMTRMHLWKAFSATSFPSFLNNSGYYYEKEPQNANYLDIKGVKFYDSVNRAIEQVSAINPSQIYCVLFEVALGESFSINHDTLKEFGSTFFHSVKIEGKNQPVRSDSLDGIDILADIQQVDSPSKRVFTYSEYIVFDKNQYVPRYMFEIEQNN